MTSKTLALVVFLDLIQSSDTSATPAWPDLIGLKVVRQPGEHGSPFSDQFTFEKWSEPFPI